MERKILRWATSFLGVLTFFVCSGLYLMPDIKAGTLKLPDLFPEKVEQGDSVQIEDDVVVDDGKLNIELPDGITKSDVEIINDYANRTVYVRFNEAIDNYSEQYMVKGSSDNISKLSYYKENGKGVLEITLDTACEHYYSFNEDFLSMELKELHEVYEKVIVIDAGHGGSQPGAVKMDISEKTINLDIVLKLKQILDGVDEKKIKVFYTRLEDSNPSLQYRAALANNVKADLFISVHNNASGDGKFSSLNGTMVLYSPESPSNASKRFAKICLEKVTESTGSTDLGLVDGDYVYIVRASEVPAVLIEVGYMTNLTELDNLCNPDYQKKVAQGIYNAIMDAFEKGF